MNEVKKSKFLHKFVEGIINSDILGELTNKESLKFDLHTIINKNPQQENIFTTKRRNLRIMLVFILLCSILLSYFVGMTIGIVFAVIGLVTYLFCANALFKKILFWFVEQINIDIERKEKEINKIVGFDLFPDR